MSYINITDTFGNPLILSLKRIDQVSLHPVEEGSDILKTCITLTPLGKDDPEDYVFSNTPVEEIWEQIKLRM